jgi:hypothetical protein
MTDPITEVLAILRAIKEDLAVIKGDMSDIRRRFFIAIEARLDRLERRAPPPSGGSGGPVDP